jgi:hypothetical protein
MDSIGASRNLGAHHTKPARGILANDDPGAMKQLPGAADAQVLEHSFVCERHSQKID